MSSSKRGEADNTGVNVTPPEQMAAEFRRACELGFPISVHAIGDRANRVVLDIFEELAQSAPQPPLPHRIEHVQIIDPADLPRLAQLGITASVQPIHATDDMDTADLFLRERGAHMYNFRTLFASGALVAFGSDAPVSDPNPFLGFHAALTRQRPERMGTGRRPGTATSASRSSRRSLPTRWGQPRQPAGTRSSAASRRASWPT